MSFSRLSVLLRLPLVALICGQLAYLGGGFSLGEHWVSPGEVTVVFDERDDDESSDTGLPVAVSKDALTQDADEVPSGLGDVSRSATLDLRATGPPSA